MDDGGVAGCGVGRCVCNIKGAHASHTSHDRMQGREGTWIMAAQRVAALAAVSTAAQHEAYASRASCNGRGRYLDDGGATSCRVGRCVYGSSQVRYCGRRLIDCRGICACSITPNRDKGLTRDKCATVHIDKVLIKSPLYQDLIVCMSRDGLHIKAALTKHSQSLAILVHVVRSKATRSRL